MNYRRFSRHKAGIILTVTALLIMSPSQTLALDEKSFMSNGIYFLDRSSTECLVDGSPGSGTPTKTMREFVKRYIKGAVEVNKKYGVPYEAMMAQAALESGYGASSLTSDHNNFFGIKADSSWNGAVVEMETQEVEGGQTITINGKFRSYPTIEAGWADYGRFINENSRYAEALKHPNDPRAYIREVHKAGYATDPNYTDKIIRLIEEIEAIVKEDSLAPPSSDIKLELVTGRDQSDDSAINNTSSHCNNNGAGVVSGDIIATAKNLSWDTFIWKWEPKPAYVEARRKYNQEAGPDYTDCGKFVATVMRASGADPEYQAFFTGSQLEYVRKNNGSKFLVIEKPQFSDLKPGDVLVNNSDSGGHTLIYAGDQGNDVWGYEASLGDTSPVQLNKNRIIAQLSQPNNVLARVIKK